MPKPAPQGTGYGPIAIGLGALALLAAIFVPLAWYLISVGVAGAGLLAWPTLRRSIDTGAPGKEQALIAFGLAGLAVVAMFVGVARDNASAGDLAGFRASLSRLGAEHLAPGLEFAELGGVGVAELAVDGVSGSVSVHCGTGEAGPTGAIGQGVSAGQGLAVAFVRGTLGDGTPDEIAMIRIGATTYARRGVGAVAVTGSDLRADGPFTEVGGAAELTGNVKVACLGFSFGP